MIAKRDTVTDVGTVFRTDGLVVRSDPTDTDCHCVCGNSCPADLPCLGLDCKKCTDQDCTPASWNVVVAGTTACPDCLYWDGTEGIDLRMVKLVGDLDGEFCLTQDAIDGCKWAYSGSFSGMTLKVYSDVGCTVQTASYNPVTVEVELTFAAGQAYLSIAVRADVGGADYVVQGFLGNYAADCFNSFEISNTVAGVGDCGAASHVYGGSGTVSRCCEAGI